MPQQPKKGLKKRIMSKIRSFFSISKSKTSTRLAPHGESSRRPESPKTALTGTSIDTRHTQKQPPRGIRFSRRAVQRSKYLREKFGVRKTVMGFSPRVGSITEEDENEINLWRLAENAEEVISNGLAWLTNDLKIDNDDDHDEDDDCYDDEKVLQMWIESNSFDNLYDGNGDRTLSDDKVDDNDDNDYDYPDNDDDGNDVNVDNVSIENGYNNDRNEQHKDDIKEHEINEDNDDERIDDNDNDNDDIVNVLEDDRNVNDGADQSEDYDYPQRLHDDDDDENVDIKNISDKDDKNDYDDDDYSVTSDIDDDNLSYDRHSENYTTRHKARFTSDHMNSKGCQVHSDINDKKLSNEKLHYQDNISNGIQSTAVTYTKANSACAGSSTNKDSSVNNSVTKSQNHLLTLRTDNGLIYTTGNQDYDDDDYVMISQYVTSDVIPVSKNDDIPGSKNYVSIASKSNIVKSECDSIYVSPDDVIILDNVSTSDVKRLHHREIYTGQTCAPDTLLVTSEGDDITILRQPPHNEEVDLNMAGKSPEKSECCGVVEMEMQSREQEEDDIFLALNTVKDEIEGMWTRISTIEDDFNIARNTLNEMRTQTIPKQNNKI